MQSYQLHLLNRELISTIPFQYDCYALPFQMALPEYSEINENSSTF